MRLYQRAGAAPAEAPRLLHGQDDQGLRQADLQWAPVTFSWQRVEGMGDKQDLVAAVKPEEGLLNLLLQVT